MQDLLNCWFPVFPTNIFLQPRGLQLRIIVCFERRCVQVSVIFSFNLTIHIIRVCYFLLCYAIRLCKTDIPQSLIKFVHTHDERQGHRRN